MVEIKNEVKDQSQAEEHAQGQPYTTQNGNKNPATAHRGYGSMRNRSLEPEQFRKIFIGGLSLATTDESLSHFYSQFGEILDCVVMRDQVKKSRGFGFISFSTSEEVDRAMAARPHEIDGKTVDPKRAVPRDKKSESNISTKRLYVSGVRDDHTEEAFEKYFSDFGVVTSVEIIPDKATGKPRGFAFINFEDYDPVDKCVLQKSHMIAGYRCDVKKALSKDEIARASQMDRDKEMRGGRSRGSQRGGPNSGGGGGYGGGGYGGGGGGGYGSGGYGGGGYGGGGRYGPGPWGGGPPQHDQWNAGPQQQWGPPGYGYNYGAPQAGGYGSHGGYGGGGYGGYGGSGGPPAAGPWASAGPPQAAAPGGGPAKGYGGPQEQSAGWGTAPSNAPVTGGWGQTYAAAQPQSQWSAPTGPSTAGPAEPQWSAATGGQQWSSAGKDASPYWK